jgi:hypothetical protein
MVGPGHPSITPSEILCIVVLKEKRSAPPKRKMVGMLLPVHSIQAFGALCVIKSYFKGQLLYFMSILCIGGISWQKKSELPDPCYHETEVFF